MILTISVLLAFRYLRLIVVESLRLFPQPPLLIRRSLKPDQLPGKVLIIIYKILQTPQCLYMRKSSLLNVLIEFNFYLKIYLINHLFMKAMSYSPFTQK